MALVYADRVQETSTTTGTGAYDLVGPDTGFQGFVTGIGNTNTCYYCATDGTDWEIGIGIVTDAGTDTLTRTKVTQSSNSDAAVDWGAGTKTIFCTLPAVSGAVIGEIKIYAGDTAPAGWLFCYGQAISRTTYATLFAVCSTTYGVGDGSTTFNVPDLRGRVVAGQDDMGGSSANRLTGVTGSVNGDTLGGTGGAETHTLVTAEMPAHTHAITYSNSDTGSGNNTFAGNGSNNSQLTTTSAGGGGAHNNVQPTIILNYMIFAGF